MSEKYVGIILPVSEQNAKRAFRDLPSSLALRFCRLAKNAFGIYADHSNHLKHGQWNWNPNTEGDSEKHAEWLSHAVGAAVFYNYHSATGLYIYLYASGRVECSIAELHSYADYYPHVDPEWIDSYKELRRRGCSEVDEFWVDRDGNPMPEGPRIDVQIGPDGKQQWIVETGITPRGEQPLIECELETSDLLRALQIDPEIEDRLFMEFNGHGNVFAQINLKAQVDFFAIQNVCFEAKRVRGTAWLMHL